MAERPLPKAIAGPGLLAQIVIDKYCGHLPLHRQQQRFSRAGINILYDTITALTCFQAPDGRIRWNLEAGKVAERNWGIKNTITNTNFMSTQMKGQESFKK